MEPNWRSKATVMSVGPALHEVALRGDSAQYQGPAENCPRVIFMEIEAGYFKDKSETTEPGLLGMRPSRKFKIFREEFPAIFRFEGKLYQELYNTATGETKWSEITESAAQRYLKSK